MKIAPQAALEAARVLWPETASIMTSKDEDNFYLVRENDTTISHIHNTVDIDWPDGVTRWPVVKKWRVPTDEDARQRKPCRVRDDDSHDWSLQIRTLLAVLPGGSHPFVTTLDATCMLLAHWQLCEIEDIPEDETWAATMMDDGGDELITGDWLRQAYYCSERVGGQFFREGFMFRRGTDAYWEIYSEQMSHNHLLCKLKTRKHLRDLFKAISVDKTT